MIIKARSIAQFKADYNVNVISVIKNPKTGNLFLDFGTDVPTGDDTTSETGAISDAVKEDLGLASQLLLCVDEDVVDAEPCWILSKKAPESNVHSTI